jgi:hypothetical protein
MQRLGIHEAVQRLNVIHVAGTKGKVRHPPPFGPTPVPGPLVFPSTAGPVDTRLGSLEHLDIAVFELVKANNHTYHLPTSTACPLQAASEPCCGCLLASSGFDCSCAAHACAGICDTVPLPWSWSAAGLYVRYD